MGYHFSIRTVRLDLGGRFNFFGADTSLAVVVRPDLGAATTVMHTGTRTVLVNGSPLRAEPTTSLDVPTPSSGKWVTDTGAPATSWAYTVTITATAPGRSPVVWRHTVNVPGASWVVALDPSNSGQLAASLFVSAGASVDPLTGGVPMPAGAGGPVNVSPDPSVAGAYLIGE